MLGRYLGAIRCPPGRRHAFSIDAEGGRPWMAEGGNRNANNRRVDSQNPFDASHASFNGLNEDDEEIAANNAGDTGLDADDIARISALSDANRARMTDNEYRNRLQQLSNGQRSVLRALQQHVRAQADYVLQSNQQAEQERQHAEHNAMLHRSGRETAPPPPGEPIEAVQPISWFITGGAGTGKSFLIQLITEYLRRAHATTTTTPVMLCAPTGAQLN